MGWGRENEKVSEKVKKRPELGRHKPMGTKTPLEPVDPGRDKGQLIPKASGRPANLPVL